MGIEEMKECLYGNMLCEYWGMMEMARALGLITREEKRIMNDDVMDM